MIKKNEPNIISFSLINKDDGEIIESGTINVYIIKDNGTQNSATNTPVNKGNGQYTLELTDEEMNANHISILITHIDGVSEIINIFTTGKTIDELNDIDEVNILNIKNKTDNLPNDPASETNVNTRLSSSSYIAPDNNTIGEIKDLLEDETIGLESIKNNNIVELNVNFDSLQVAENILNSLFNDEKFKKLLAVGFGNIEYDALNKIYKVYDVDDPNELLIQFKFTNNNNDREVL